MFSQPVWLITGVSSGFGYLIATKALDTGARVIGTVRSRQGASKEVEGIENKGGKCLELDVTDADACFGVYEEAKKVFGRIDVLINNAGLSWIGCFEDHTDNDIKAQMEVNVYGPLRLIRAALPGFRQQKSGTIVNITSLAGIVGVPSVGVYSLSKFAIEGITESLAGELKEHNISVLLVEPGSFRTNFLGAYKSPTPKHLEQYSAAKAMVDHFSGRQGSQPGDPEKAAARMVEVISGTGEAGKLKGKVLRLVLGPDCVAKFDGKIKSMQDDLEACREVAMSTNIE